jgi:hypothetical protein
MNTSLLRVLAAAGLGVATLAVAQNSVRAGQYEMTIEMQMPGAPAPMKMTQKDCLTQAEAADFFKLMRAEMTEVEGCQLTEPVISGNKVTWDTTCDGISASSELTFTSDGFGGVVRSVVEGEVLQFTMNARWIGATCTDDGDD